MELPKKGLAQLKTKMKEETIKGYLEKLKKEVKSDKEFVEILIVSYNQKEEGLVTADKILAAIEERYAKNQGHKS